MDKSLFIYDLPLGKFKDGEEEKLADFLHDEGVFAESHHIRKALSLWFREGTYGYISYIRKGYDSQIDMYERRFDMPKGTRKVSFYDIVKSETLEEVLYGS